jgi:mannose-6-phosphate isomerase-like protein (cupin superfamily)
VNKHTIHESETQAVQLPGRVHKMIIGPHNFGPAKHMCFGVAEFPPQQHAPAHVHPNEEEILYVLMGSGEFYFDGVPEPVESGTCIYIPPGVEHSINNTSDEVMKVVYVFSPPVVQGSYDRHQA